MHTQRESRLYSWGANKCGELGHGDVAKRVVPRLVKNIKVYCSVLQCIAACCSLLQRGDSSRLSRCIALCCSVLQSVAACCSAVNQARCLVGIIKLRCRVFQSVALCFSEF